MMCCMKFFAAEPMFLVGQLSESLQSPCCAVPICSCLGPCILCAGCCTCLSVCPYLSRCCTSCRLYLCWQGVGGQVGTLDIVVSVAVVLGHKTCCLVGCTGSVATGWGIGDCTSCSSAMCCPSCPCICFFRLPSCLCVSL